MFNPFFCDNSFTFVLCVKYSDWNSNFSSNNIVLEPSSYHKTQLIILYANQLRTKTLANLHSRALALMREPHIQTIYPCNVYPLCLSFKIHYHVFLYPAHLQFFITTVYIFIKMLYPFSKCMNVFNLSEEAVNRCKALISVSYDTPSPLPSSHTLNSRGTGRERKRFGVSRQDLAHPEKANKLQQQSMKGGRNAYICIN